jgi:hypothetical protein
MTNSASVDQRLFSSLAMDQGRQCDQRPEVETSRCSKNEAISLRHVFQIEADHRFSAPRTRPLTFARFALLLERAFAHFLSRQTKVGRQKARQRVAKRR